MDGSVYWGLSRSGLETALLLVLELEPGPWMCRQRCYHWATFLPFYLKCWVVSPHGPLSPPPFLSLCLPRCHYIYFYVICTHTHIVVHTYVKSVTHKRNTCLSFWGWLNSLNMSISTCFHFPASDMTPFFSWLGKNPHNYITFSFSPVPQPTLYFLLWDRVSLSSLGWPWN